MKSNALTRLLVVIVLGSLGARAFAQGKLSPAPTPVEIGPELTGVTVYSNSKQKVDYSLVSGGEFEFGDDLHFVRSGFLSSLEFTFVAFADPGPIDVEVRFYTNDETNGGHFPGEAGIIPLVDLIAAFVVEDLPVVEVLPGNSINLDPFYRVRAEVNPPIYLPQHVWMTVVFPQEVSIMGLGMSRAPLIGISDPLIYVGGSGLGLVNFVDSGSFNFNFEVRMEPSPADTPMGTNVTVKPEPNVTLTFDNVTKTGATEVTTSAINPFPDASFEFLGVFYDIDSNAQFNGSVEVCLNYDDTGLSIDQEQTLQLLHYENGAWVDITTTRDTTSNIICGGTTTLSPFAIGHRLYYPAQDLIDALIGEIELLNIKHGVANSLDVKLQAAKESLSDFNEMNNQSAIFRLQAFINEVEAKKGNELTEAEAVQLQLRAFEILGHL